MITAGRLVAVAVLFVLLIFLNMVPEGSYWSKALSLVSGLLFASAMFSDMLDGYLARKYKMVSTFGTFIDPLADKLLFLVAMILLIPLGWFSAWMTVLFMVREITVTALRSVAVEKGLVISASHWGKYKSAFISSAMTGILLHYSFLNVHWREMGWLFIIPGLIFSLLSGVHYCWQFVTHLKGETI
ncbi:MAG: CDP-diacylglycerol--glycerol-3-phosphate 3-phosphatidyltransferase [Pseudomonadota bacterium]